MDSQNFLHAFMEAFQKNIPPVLSGLGDVLKDHVRSSMESVLHKMDVVSREEFDSQVLLLRRSREKLDMLEKKISQLQENKSK